MTIMSVGPASIMLVERAMRARNGMSAEAYDSRLSMVLAVINNGAIGGGTGYGCPEHKTALIEIEKQIAETRERIAQMEAKESEYESAT